MKDCYIFDIDGTLSDASHRIHHITTEGQSKDWHTFFSLVGGDTPIAHIIQLAQDLWSSGSYIIYVSGRSDECREATEQWLKFHRLPTGKVYMRKAGDYRDDTLIKVELLEQVRADGWNPIMAFDDRNRVVAAWRAAGVPCAQVAPGDF